MITFMYTQRTLIRWICCFAGSLRRKKGLIRNKMLTGFIFGIIFADEVAILGHRIGLSSTFRYMPLLLKRK